MESTEARHHNRNLKFHSIDEMEESSLRLTYLSHDARRILEVFQVKDEEKEFNIFYQATLILWCHNYGIDKTYEVIFKSIDKSFCRVIDAIHKDSGFAHRKRKLKRHDDEDISRAADEEMTPEEKKKRQRLAAKQARKIQNAQEQNSRSVFSKFNLGKVSLDVEKFYYLYLIDRSLLIADWSIKLDSLFRIFSKIAENDLIDLLNEMVVTQGRCNMWLVSSKLEEFVGRTAHAVDEVKNFSHVVIEKPLYHLSDEARQKAIDDLNEERRNRGEKPHGYS